MHPSANDNSSDSNFVLSRTALVETYACVEFIYGRWDTIFGAWIVRAGVAREYVPPFGAHFNSGLRPVQRACEYCPHSEHCDPRLERTQLVLEAECECWFFWPDPWNEDCEVVVEELPPPVKSYGDQIPAEIRRATDRLAKYAWLGLEACWDDPTFPRILATLTQRRYVTCVWTLTNARAMTRAQRRALNKSLAAMGPAQALHLHIFSVSPQALMNVLRRLSEECVDEATLSGAISVVSSGGSPKWLRHVRNVPAAALAEICRLPSWARHPKCISGLVRGGYAAREFRETVEQLSDQIDEKAVASLKARLPEVTSPEDLRELICNLETRVLRAAPFPPPPIGNVEQLEAISSFDRLWEEGARMRNCCAGYHEDILRGRMYFYHWYGAEPATVCLEATSGRWEPTEIVLASNNSPSVTTTLEIRQLIESAQRGA